MSTDTRADNRTGVSVKVRFKSTTLDEFIERYSVDISRGGMFIRTRDPLAVGTVIRFEFTLDDSSPVLAGDATVVWRREHDPQRPGAPAGMGVKFDALTAESRQVLERILEAKNRVETGQAQAIGSSQPIPVPKGVHMDEDDELLRQPTKVAPLDELLGDGADDVLAPHERTVVAPAKSAELARRSTTLDGRSPPSASPSSSRPATSQSLIPRAVSAPPIPVDVAPTGADDAPTGSLLVTPTPSPDFSPPTPTPLPTTAYVPPSTPPPAYASQQPYAPPSYAKPSATMSPPGYGAAMHPSAPGGAGTMPPAFTPSSSATDAAPPDLARQLAHAATYGSPPLAQGTGPGALMGRVSGMTAAIQPQRKIFWVLGLVGGAALIAGGIALVVHGGRGDPKVTIAAAKPPAEEDPVTAPVEPVRPVPRTGPVDLEVVTHPEGAQLHIDGQPFDQPTPTILRGLDGRKSVKLVAVHECYEPAALEVTPDPSRPVEIVLKPREYALTITSTPPGAIAKIDGREIGATPKTIVLGKSDLDHALLVTLTRAGFAEKVVSFDPRQTCDQGKGALHVPLKR